MKKYFKSNFQLAAGLTIILAAALVSFVMIVIKHPVPKAEIKTKSTVVTTIPAKKITKQIEVEAFGTVRARRELALVPDVGGRIVYLSPNFIDGGLLKAGEVILRIDPVNYIGVVDQEKAAVRKAELELQMEAGKRTIAKREWQLLGASLKETGVSEDLVLRVPHYINKEAELQAAKRRLEKAEMNLESTVVVAPFDALVLSEEVETGQVISASSKIGKLVSTDLYEVQVSIPFEKIDWIDLPRDGKTGSGVIVYQNVGSNKSIDRKGEVQRILGDVDKNGRMARLIVGIPDPLGLLKTEAQQLPLLIGAHVKVKIFGSTLDGVYQIPREAVREGSRIWVKSPDDTLEIKEIQIIARHDDYVIIDKGIAENDHIIISNIPVAIPGMRLKSSEEGV